MLLRLLLGPWPFSKKDDEEILVSYLMLRYIKKPELIDRLSDERQQEIIENLLILHREKWYFTPRVLFIIPVALIVFVGLFRVFGISLKGDELVLEIFVVACFATAAVFILFYGYKHFDLWKITKSDEAKRLIET